MRHPSLILTASLLICWPVCGEMERATSLCNSPDSLKLVEEADAAYHKRLDELESKKALDLYEKAIASDPACVEFLIKASKSAWWIADHSPTKKEKLNIFQKAIDFSKKAIQLNPNSAAAHFWLAGNYGSYGETRGVLKSLSLVKPMKAELNEVIKIDPYYDEGGAYRVLGVMDYKVPGFAGGNRKRAKELLNISLDMGPKNPFTLFYLAEFYELMGDKTQAAAYLDQLDELTPTEEEKPDWVMMTEKGKLIRERNF